VGIKTEKESDEVDPPQPSGSRGGSKLISNGMVWNALLQKQDIRLNQNRRKVLQVLRTYTGEQPTPPVGEMESTTIFGMPPEHKDTVGRMDPEMARVMKILRLLSAMGSGSHNDSQGGCGSLRLGNTRGISI